MSNNQEVTYTFDSRAGTQSRRKQNSSSSDGSVLTEQRAKPAIPRIARLMALAIRFDGLLREKTIADRAELARLGRVTRARMTQIMKLLHLAPDIQERILFLPPTKRLNERNLRCVVAHIDWDEQRRIFARLIHSSDRAGHSG